MSFQWNVQPYQFVYEAQKAYTQTLMLATRKRADVIRVEAKQWMKDNAPWKDRTGRARASLHVSKQQDPGEVEYNREMRLARNDDNVLLQELNAERSAKKRSAISQAKSLFESGDVTGARRLQRKIETQKRYQQLRRVPRGQSKVAALKRMESGYKAPLVTLKFQYYKGPPWSLWLEIANQGRWGIISRAVEYWGARMMYEVERLARLKQFRESVAFGPTIGYEEYEVQSFAENQRERRIAFGESRTRSWSSQLAAQRRYNRARNEQSAANRAIRERNRQNRNKPVDTATSQVQMYNPMSSRRR